MLISGCGSQASRPISDYDPGYEATPDTADVVSTKSSGHDGVAEDPTSNTPDYSTNDVSGKPELPKTQTSPKLPNQIAAGETVDDLIADLAQEFSWDRHLQREEVSQRIRDYQKKPDQVGRILARSTPFLSLIAERVRSRNLPTELVFLPMIESGFQTAVQSSAGAAGLWQLMPSTARHLELKSDWWLDQRLDILLATDKALDYLQYLYYQFNGDWELAIAAYNGGESHVRARMRRANSDNLWDLKLKNETESYLPALLALTEILKNPTKYGINLPVISRQNRLTELPMPSQIDLRLAAAEIDMSYTDFRRLNPSFKRWISPPGDGFRLLVPDQQVAQLKKALESLQPDHSEHWDQYQVQSGDNLIRIARRFGTTVRAIVSVNQMADSRIFAHQTLLIPRNLNPAKISRPGSIKELYVVRTGDSLWKIARRHGISMRQLRQLNEIDNSSLIQPGMVLILSEEFVGNST